MQPTPFSTCKSEKNLENNGEKVEYAPSRKVFNSLYDSFGPKFG